MGLNAEDMLLSALQGSANTSKSAAASSVNLADILKQLGAQSNLSAAATDTKAQSTAAANDQVLQGEQQAQDSTRKFADAAGTNIASPSDILVGLGQQLREQIQTAQATQKTIQQKESVNIVDHPVDWLTGQLTLKQDYQTYNDAADSANLTSSNIQALTAATDEVQRTQLNLAQKITDASRVNAANATIAQGTLEKSNILQGQLKNEITIAGMIQNNTATQAKAAQEQYGLYMQGEQFKQEQEKFQVYKQQVTMEAATAKLKAANAADQASMQAKLIAQYNIGASTLGYPPETNWDLIQAKMNLGGTDAARISAAMEAGGNSIVAGGSPRVSGTPGGAASLINGKLYPRASDAMFDPMKKYLTDTYAASLARPDVQGKNQAALAVQATNAQVAQDTKNFTENAVAHGSFYAPPALTTIIGTASVQATPFYQKVLSTAGKDLTTAAPTPIINLALAAAGNGTVTYEQAAQGITEMYGKAVTLNNLTKRYAQVGIAPQTSFNVKPDIPGLDTTKVDLTNYGQVLRALALAKAAQSDFTAGTYWKLQQTSPVHPAQ